MLVWKVDIRVGTAMFTIVVSSMIMKKPRQSAGKMLHGLRPWRSTSARGAVLVDMGTILRAGWGQEA